MPDVELVLYLWVVPPHGGLALVVPVCHQAVDRHVLGTQVVEASLHSLRLHSVARRNLGGLQDISNKSKIKSERTNSMAQKKKTSVLVAQLQITDKGSCLACLCKHVIVMRSFQVCQVNL